MKRAAKAALVFVEIAAVFAAVFAAAAAFFYFKLQSGPAGLTFFKPSVEFALERHLPAGYDAVIEEITIQQNANIFLLSLTGVQISDGSNQQIAGADAIDVTFRTNDLLDRKGGPRTINATGAQFRIVRTADQAVKIPAARGRGGRSLLRGAPGLFNDRLLESAFERAEMLDAKVTFYDEASGRSWISEDTALTIERTTEGISGAINGNLDIDGADAAFQGDGKFAKETEIISISLFGDNFPLGDVLTTFFGNNAGVIDAPVSGNADVVLSASGEVRSSSFNARIEEGTLILGAANTPIKFIEWNTGFDPQTNKFTVDKFSYDVAGNTGMVTGDIALDFGEDVRDPERIRFDLSASDLALSFPEQLPTLLPISAATLKGSYDVKRRGLTLQDYALSLLGVEFLGQFDLIMPRREGEADPLSPGVVMTLDVNGDLDHENLLKVWPFEVASGARDWLDDKLVSATLSNISAEMNLPAGAIVEGKGLPDDSLKMTFDVANAKAFVVHGMTPISNGAGSGILTGNRFFLEAERANVGDIEIREGEIEFPEFMPKHQPTYYRFLATGKSEQILGVIDEAPLNLLSKINLSPEQFVGDATARIEVMRPNKRDALPDEYEYRGEATFENMLISGLAGDADVTEGKGSVTLQPRYMVVKADAKLTDAPIQINWHHNFFALEDGPGTFDMSGTVDAGVADLYGLSLRQYVRGPIDLSLKAIGNVGDLDTLSLEADFSQSSLSFGVLDWRKPAGAPAQGLVDIRYNEQGFDVTKLAIQGEGVNIEGNLTLNQGLLERAAFPQFLLEGGADLSATAVRGEAGELVIVATGNFLNAGPALRLVLDNSAAPPAVDDEEEDDFWGAGISVTARVDELQLRENIRYRDASLDFLRDDTALQAFDLSALNLDGSPLKALLSHTVTNEGPTRLIEARSSNLGNLLKGVFAYNSLARGEGSMALRFGDPNLPGIAGKIEARNMHVSDAPLMARLFSAGSFEGLANLMNGEGIDLSYAFGEFQYRDDMVSLRKFRATGPSVGITAEGDVSFSPDGKVALQGAVAPLYQLNSALGAAPIIGDMLVGKKGEGIFALSYAVNGDRTAPTVTVNPLSALTPGIFRQMFDARRPEVEIEAEPETIEPGQEQELSSEPG